MEEIGQVPVTINKEIDGFGLNRIQYAIINECWNLVQVVFVGIDFKFLNLSTILVFLNLVCKCFTKSLNTYHVYLN